MLKYQTQGNFKIVRVRAISTSEETLQMKWAIELTLLVNLSVQALCLKIWARHSPTQSHTSDFSARKN